MKYLICTVISFAIAIAAAGQTYSLRQYTLLDGLPQNQIYILMQDSKGFIWIGTKNGVSRFDGLEFVNYYQEDGLLDNFCIGVTEDSKGAIWVLTKFGLSRFTGHAFVSYPYMLFPDINDFIPDNNGNIWLFSREGFGRILCFKEGRYFQLSEICQPADTIHEYSSVAYDYEKGLLMLSTPAHSIYAIRDNSLQVLPFRGDYVYNVKRKLFLLDGKKNFRITNGKLQEEEPFSNKMTFMIKNHLYPHSEDSIFLNTGAGNLRLKWNTKNVYSPIQDADGVFWIPSEGGLSRIISDAFVNFIPRNGIAPLVWSVMEDKNQHIWFGSLDARLQEYDGRKLIGHPEYRKVDSDPIYMGGRKISNGDMYIATGDGACIWDGHKLTKVSGIHGQVQYILENPDDHAILFGSSNGLFYRKNNKTILYPEITDNGKYGITVGMTMDNKGFYWLITSHRVLRFDGKTFYPFNDSIVPVKHGMTADCDSAGRIWIGGMEGLCYYDYVHNAFRSVLPPGPYQTVKFVKVMDCRHVMAGRMKDFVIIDLDKMEAGQAGFYRIYDHTDGFLGMECRQNGILKDSRGYYWMNTNDRVVRLDVSKLKDNPNPPRLYISGLYVQNDSLQWISDTSINIYSDNPLRAIDLNHRQGTIEFTFTGISTPNPEKVVYSYRLLPYEVRWSLPGTVRKASFANLPPGNYTFEVKAGNADGVWTIHPVILQVNIIPAFWQTLAFRIILIVLILLAGYILIYLMLRRQQRSRNEKQELLRNYSRLQMSMIMRQFDPHFTFNAISSIGSMIMKGEKESAYEYFVKLSNLLRAALSENDQLTKTLGQELDFVKDYCDIQKMRFRERFDYSLYVDENVDMKLPVPKMIIQSFVENSIKHGIEHKADGGKVDISVERNGNDLLITIRDNGIGRAAATQKLTAGTGKGQQITGRLFDLMNQKNRQNIRFEIKDLLDKNRNPAGTEVKINLPLNFNYELN